MAWTQENSKAAAAEGWDVFDCDDEMQIQHCDDSGALPDDLAAWRMVVEGVRRGSPLHLAAFDAIGAEERDRIEYVFGKVYQKVGN